MAKDNRSVYKETCNWPLEIDSNGLIYQQTPWGFAYSHTPVPFDKPLTYEDLTKLRSDSVVMVLWSGGNGPHIYILSDVIHDLHGTGVGNTQMFSKVWVVKGTNK